MARDGAPQQRLPAVENPVGPLRVAPGFLRCIGFAVFCFAVLPSAKAQTLNVSGSYECTQAMVDGKVIPCTAAPLILKDNGHFELRGWEGSYLVDGEWVELSDSLTKARAKIAPGHKIVLRYFGKHGWEEMTYERRVAEMGKIWFS
jgi:hypothetical protein